MNTNFKIEIVGNPHVKYRYFEVFYKSKLDNNPFLRVEITLEKELQLIFLPFLEDVPIMINDIEEIISYAKEFMPKAILDEEFTENWLKEIEDGDDIS